MATTRAIAIASNSTCSLLSRKSFLLKQQKPFLDSLCLKNLKVVYSSSKRSYTCRAIYNPQVQVKEEGQPESLDYRVFFVDKSGKKVRFCRFRWRKWELGFEIFRSMWVNACGLWLKQEKCDFFAYFLFHQIWVLFVYWKCERIKMEHKCILDIITFLVLTFHLL